MTRKQAAIQGLETLPEDASWEDIEERVHFIAGVRAALSDLDAGNGVPHDRVREEFAAWLSE